MSFATQEARVLVSGAAVLDWLRVETLKGAKAWRQWKIRECDLEAYLVEPVGPHSPGPHRACAVRTPTGGAPGG